METKKNMPLQKLTVSDLLKVKEIQKDDFDKLTNDEKDELFDVFNDKVYNLQGYERDKAIRQISNIMSEDSKKTIWEHNHELILLEMHKHIINHGRMPLMKDLETITGLSRPTITSHLKDYKESELYMQYKEQYHALHTKVLDVVYKLSMSGDMKACKLFLEATGQLNRASTYIDKQQNNSIHNIFAELSTEDVSMIIKKLKKE